MPLKTSSMKKITLAIMAISVSLCLNAQIPNNGFENWTNMGTYGNPDQWGTLNDFTASANTFTCTKGTPGNPGTSYLKLVSKSVTGMGIMPGIAVSGILNTGTMQAVSGFPFTGRPEFLEGKWQYMANGADMGYISVLLTRWNIAGQHRDTIASAYLSLPDMVMSWRNFSITLNYLSGADPDSAIITASASNAEGAAAVAGSYLYLDALAFTGLVAGIIPKTNDVTFRIYPNPVEGTLFINFAGNPAASFSLEIYDTFGQIVMSAEYPSLDRPIPVSVRYLEAGNYFVRITSGKNKYTQQFSRKR